MLKRTSFNFYLPDELIAQYPSTKRDEARLLVVDAIDGKLTHTNIRHLPDWIPDRAVCIPNDVKVRHARLFLRRSSGGSGEALVVKFLGNNRFEALVRPGNKLKPGKSANVLNLRDNSVVAELFIEAELCDGLKQVSLQGKAPIDWEAIDSIGYLPLPPYIQRPADIQDDDRYQTVFHSAEGEAIAAPTAGLHFTPALIESLRQKKCSWCPVRLHVGLGTFRPMTADNIEEHIMHEERYEIPEATANEIERALGSRNRDILAIGTTSLRALEAAWDGTKLERSGTTRIFIRPGYKLKTANFLLTNFHLPESTLFVLVSAILGIDLAHKVYRAAVQEKYRFFSYGDAMLIMNIRK